MGCIGSSKATTRRHLYAGWFTVIWITIFFFILKSFICLLLWLYICTSVKIMWREKMKIYAPSPIYVFYFIFFICSRLDVTFIHAFLSFQFNCHCRYHVSVFVCVNMDVWRPSEQVIKNNYKKQQQQHTCSYV